MLQMEMSAVIEGSVMDVSGEMDLKITLLTSTPKKEKRKKRKKKRKRKKKGKEKRMPSMRKIRCAEKEPGPPQEAQTR